MAFAMDFRARSSFPSVGRGPRLLPGSRRVVVTGYYTGAGAGSVSARADRHSAAVVSSMASGRWAISSGRRRYSTQATRSSEVKLEIWPCSSSTSS